MSKAYNVELQQKLEQYLEAEGLSQAKAAPILGLSTAVLSQYRRSVYDKGDIEEVEKSWRSSSGSRRNRGRISGRRSPSGPTSRGTFPHQYPRRPTR